jgi:hypothetical protein
MTAADHLAETQVPVFAHAGGFGADYYKHKAQAASITSARGQEQRLRSGLGLMVSCCCCSAVVLSSYLGCAAAAVCKVSADQAVLWSRSTKSHSHSS